ncbi:AAA family ATPase [Gramella jeungdoensis]|uniref:AAA family ATPase n=1 Tax=Gramella jeungdoensis TaxID=708091 RepID=A0ABT0Z2S5_9FLAO|nr:AAA family ATPase [Gramella jeungdoensis]MCM8569695.1 AAA family ATPase [Gramella jeungdoensis]
MVEDSKEKSILKFFKFEPTPDQMKVLLNLESFITNSSEDFLIINGAAGTGKTLLMSSCIAYLRDKGIANNLAAPTGRAARILASKAHVPCSTIHSLIYNVNTDPEEGTIRFSLKENESTEYTVYIIDEASMVSSQSESDQESLFEGGNCVLDDLIYYGKQGNDLNKFIFVGDKNQLPPVKESFSAALSSKFLKEKYNLEGTSLKLNTVKRQKTNSSLFKCINNIREVIENTARDLGTEAYFSINTQAVAEHLYALDLTENGHEYCTALAYNHSKNLQFNQRVRSLLFNYPKEKLVPGELLIINRTLRKPEYTLYNGDHVIVKEIDLQNTEIIEGLEFAKVVIEATDISNERFEIKDYILLDTLEKPKGLGKKKEKALHKIRKIQNKKYRDNGNAMEDPFLGAIRALYGYSITIHKAQGGEWDKVYISDWYPPSKTYYNSKYTAFTRAKEEVFVYNLYKLH